MKNKKIFTFFLLVLFGLSIFANNSLTTKASTVNHLLITEVLYDAPTNDATEEWVELYNPTTSSINVQGWTINDNVGSFALPSISIPSNGYLILAKSALAFSALYGFQPNVTTFSLSLSNSGDQLSLRDSAQVEVDFVAWENYVAGWSVSAVDTTIQRIKDLNQMPIDTDSGADWEASGTLGTPGSGYGAPSTPASNESIQVFFNDPIAGLPWMDNPTAQAGNLSTGLVSLLNSANTSIDAALYHLEWQDVITALINAKNRGVTVRIAAYNDSITAGDFDSLISNGISVTGVTTPYIMHNKFFIVDSDVVWTGSYNPTITGSLFNANDGVKITSANVASIYQAEFDQLFADIYASHKVDNNDEITTVNGEPFEVYFAPKDTGKTRLLDLINSANQSIYLSLFYMTDNDIYNALYSAYSRGVYIRAVFDYRGWSDQYAEAKQMIDLGLGVVDANPGVYHFKFGVFDSQIVWTGSTNWSSAGFSSNDENSIVIHDSTIAQQYIAKTIEYYNDAVNYDNSLTQAPRIVTHHYSSSPGSNFIEWRTHLNGNLANDNVQQYLVWRWNDTRNNYDFLQAVDYATGYYTDSDVVSGTTYYYCISALINNQMTGCSAEFAQVGVGGSQPTIYPPRNSLQYFGQDTTAPVVSLVNPQDGAVVSGYLDIGVTASDASYLSQWQIFVDNTFVSNSSLFNIDTTTLTDGSHTITGKVKDVFGNWGQRTVTVTVNNTNHTPVVNPSYNNLKVMTYNVQESGLNPTWIDVVKEENPDVAILVETGNWDDIGNKSLNQIVIDLNNNFPNQLPYHAMTLQGMGSKYTGISLLSRFSILQQDQIPIVQLDDGTYFDVSHDFLHAKLAIGTGTVNIIGAHLKATAGTSNEYKRERAQEGIINYIDSLGTQPILYMGDFNSFSPYDTGVLAPNGTLGDGPVSMLFGYGNYSQYAPTVQNFTDVFRSLNPTDPGFTYPEAPYTSRIDFIFASNYFADKLLISTVGDTLSASTGSDHYDVDVNLNLTAFGPVDSTPPAQVQNVQAQINANNTVDLSWIANTEPDLYIYRIYRNNTFIAETNQPYYTDNGVLADTGYSYQVSAVDVNLNEGLKSTTTDIYVPSSGSTSVTKILISEVYYDTIGTDSKEEYIELYNPGSTAVDLSGWQLKDNVGTYTIPQGTVINATGFLIIARNSAGFNALFGFNPDVSGLTLSLGNSGDQVALYNTTGSQIDFVAWENYVAGWSITAKTGQVITRITLTVDTDTVNDWMVANPNPI